jgi:hypothetical protein
VSLPACCCPLECLQFVPLCLQFATLFLQFVPLFLQFVPLFLQFVPLCLEFATLFAEGTLQDLSMSAAICASTPRTKSKVEELGMRREARHLRMYLFALSRLEQSRGALRASPTKSKSEADVAHAEAEADKSN